MARNTDSQIRRQNALQRLENLNQDDRQNSKTTTQTAYYGGSASRQSALDRLNALGSQEDDYSFHQAKQKRISSILQEAQKYAASIQKKLQGMNWSNADQIKREIDADSSRMLKEYGEIKQYVDTYGDQMDVGAKKSLEDALKWMDDLRINAQSAAGSGAKKIASFESEDAWIKGAVENRTQRQQRYADNQKQIQALEAQRDRLTPSNMYNPDTSLPLPVFDAQYYERKKTLNAQIKALQEENRNYEKGENGWYSKELDDNYENLVAQQKREQGYQQKYAGKSYDQVSRILAQMPEGEEKEWLKGYAPSLMTAQDYDREIDAADQRIAALEAQAQAWKTAANTWSGNVGNDPVYLQMQQMTAKYGSLDAVSKALDQAKKRKWELENGKKYNLLEENADWEEKSVAPKEGIDINLIDAFSGSPESNYNMVNGFYNKEALDEDRERNFIFGRIEDALLDDLAYISKEERKKYNYLYNTQGIDAAEEYLKSLKSTLGERANKYTAGEWAKMAEAMPVQTSIASVPLTLWGGIGYVDALGQKLVGDIKEAKTGEYAGPVNFNSAAMMPAMASSAIRGTVSQNLADEYGVIQMDEQEHPYLSRLLNGKSWGDVYQLGMSMVDSAAVATLSPVLGTAGTLMLSGNAATQGMLDAVANGASDEQALMMGALSGAFEYLFEKYELEGLLRNGSKNAVRAFTAQALSEGFGEGATTIANLVADTIIMADKSQLSRAVAAYMEKNPGMSEKEATRKAVTDMAIQTGWDAIGGMVTGGIMGGGYSAVDKVSTGAGYAKVGQSLLQDQTAIGDLVSLAGNLGADLTEQAQRVTQKPTSQNVGRLYTEVSAAVQERGRSVLVQQLHRQGVEANTAQKIAQVVVEARTGSELTEQKRSILESLQQDKNIRAAVEAVFDNPSSPVYQMNQQLRSVMQKASIPQSPAAPGQTGTDTGAYTEKDIAGLKVIMAQKLTEHGVETKTAQRLAPVIVASRTGSQVSAQQADLLASIQKDNNIMAAVNEVFTSQTASLQTPDNNVSSIKEQLINNQETINRMDPVTSIQTPKSFSQLDIAGKINWVIEKLRPTGYKVERKGLGTINFGSKQLKGAFKYFAKGSVEEAAFEALPYVLEKGTEISEHTDHKGREYGTVTIAAPVTIDGKRGNMAVVVKKTTDNFYKVHRILTPEGSVFELNENRNEAEPTSTGESPNIGSLATPISSASDTNIPQPMPGVNGEVVADEVESAEGKVLRGNTAVQIAGVVNTDRGKLQLKLADGSTADVSELSFPENGEAELWQVVTEYAGTAEAAQTILQEYRNSDLDASRFARGVEEGILFGSVNMSPKEMNQRGNYVYMLSKAQRDMVYQIGQARGELQTQMRDQEVRVGRNMEGIATEPAALRNGKGKRIGAVHYGYEGQQVDKNRLNRTQAVGVHFAEKLARKKGMTFYFFASEEQNGVRVFKNARGKTVELKENGWYDPTDGSIHIDLNCGDMGSTVLYTIAHELTHFIKDMSPAKYRTLCSIVTEGYLDHGQSVQELVKNKQKEYAALGEELTWEEAYDEVIASSMEGIISDGEVMDLLDEIETRDKNLYEQIVSFLKDVAQLIAETIDAYRNVKPESPEGRMVMRMKGIHAQLQQVFAEALHDAGENFREGGKTNTANQGGVKYSYIGNTKDGRRCYQSEFDDSVSMDDRIKAFKERIASIFNLGAVELKTDVKKIRIRGDRFTSQKNLFGDAKAEGSEYSAKINSLYDLADILATSKYDPNATGKEPSYANPNVPPKNAAHKNVKYWYKFRNEIVFDGVPYTVTFNIRDKGSEQYQYLIDFNENKTPGISNTAVNKPPASKPSVLQGQYTQSKSKSQQNSLRYQKNQAAQAHVAQQNSSLEEDVQALNQLTAEQRKRGNAGKLQQSTLNSAASFLMKTAGAKGDKSQLMQILDSFYTYVGTTENTHWEDVREQALPVVRWLMDNTEHSQQRSEYAQDILNYLRGCRISLDEQQKKEVAHLYGTFGGYRNMLMGSITIANEGMSLDSQWHELSGLYPDVFDEEMTASDMPEALLDIVHRLRNEDTSALEYEYNREFIEQDLLQRVYDSYWNASTLYSVADHYEARIKELKGKHRKRMEQVYYRHRAAEINQKTAYQQKLKEAQSYYEERYQRREAEYKESRQKAVERHDQAQVRQQIRKDVEKLDGILNRGNKEKNVKLELKEFAGAALRVAKGSFLKNYNEYDMIRSGVSATLSRDQKAVFNRCQELLRELDKIRDEKNAEPGPDNMHEKWDPEAVMRRDDREEALKKELAKNMKILRDDGIFRLENELIEDGNADQLMAELMEAYEKLQNSGQEHVRRVYSAAVYAQMDKVKEFLAGKAIKDMTAVQLTELHKMYRMVLHTITHSNDLFAQKRKADVKTLGEEVISQLQTEGKEMIPEILDTLAKMGWANLKPETALEVIGSDTLTEMMQGLYRGEDTYARDIEDARRFAEEQGKKYGRKNWDMKKPISFAGTKITLGQAMSLYAYTKRKQAQGHLEGEGFTHSKNVRIEKPVGKLPVKLSYIMNATKTYIVSRVMYEKVEQLLTPEQKQYADAMQEYLSKVMGAKGNEVSMQMYGIKLFEEKAYFPLKTAQEYHDEALGATTGEVKLKNSGFTKKPEKDAANPIVLDSFEAVWAAHVDKMSLYHGFVLPMEDFDRVYNYHRSTEVEETNAWGEAYTREVDSNETVKVDIQNKAGEAANDYIENFMKELNGGVRSDGTATLFGKITFPSFKKTAVLGSLSVAVQQPTAFIRAMAYLDMRDIADFNSWLGKAGKPEGKLVEEMYKYAPVALMKHIGGFDPSLNRKTEGYILEEKKTVRSVLDKFLGSFPEKMDEWTWSYIWLCTKRQIHRKYPSLKIGSEEFNQKAGERFSQIIRDTQVYDSVLTKSQIMRSKNVFLQMATSFMNEPSTGMDMYIRSTLQAKRGKISKAQAARTYASVVGSQILAAAVAAFVYALRDDDEDKTYWEKYISAAVSKAWENLMPWYSIPFVKDIFSIFEGYSVERSDMSIITDIYQGWKKLSSGNATAWEKTEAFAGSVLNLFGIPLKNVSRDIRGIWNTVDVWINKGIRGTDAGMRYALQEGITGKKPSKAEQLLNAVAENDAAHIMRVLATYSNEESAFTAFRSAVKGVYLQGQLPEEKAAEFLQTYAGHDEVAAQEYVREWQCELETGFKYDELRDAFIAGEITQAKAQEMFINYGGYDDDEAEAYVRKLLCEKETGVSYDDIREAFVGGEITEKQLKQIYVKYGGHTENEAEVYARELLCEKETGIQYDDIREAFVDGELTEKQLKQIYIKYGGHTENEAEVYAQELLCEKEIGIQYDDIREAFVDGEITEKQARQMYIRYGGYSAEDADGKVEILRFRKKYPESELTDGNIPKYLEFAAPVGISPEIYGRYLQATADLKADKDANGKTISGSKRQKVLAAIHKLPLSRTQKDALYFANGYAEGTLDEAPWN